MKIYNNIRKIMTSQSDDYTIQCIFHPYFRKYHKLIAIDLSKQQKLDADPKIIQQINFTGNLDRAEGLTIFSIIEEAKETVLHFPKGTVKILPNITYILSNWEINKLKSAIENGTEVTFIELDWKF